VLPDLGLVQAARRPHVRVRVDEAGHDRLAGDVDVATPPRQARSDEPRRPTAAMRLSVTSTSPLAITSSPFIVTMRAPVSSTDPLGLARGTSTVTSVISGSSASIALPVELRAPAPT
jgi:hypothetical protein